MQFLSHYQFTNKVHESTIFISFFYCFVLFQWDLSIKDVFSLLGLKVLTVVWLLVIPAGALQTESGLHTLAVSGGASGGTIVQYATNQDGFYVPG